MLSLILGLIVGAVSVVFAFQNVFPVTVTFFAWNITGSLALIIAFSLLSGLLIAALLSIPEAVRSTFLILNLKKENKKLTEELEQLKNQKETVVITPVETQTVEQK